MAEVCWDFIVVGQGLAGTTLAWHLIEAGQRVLIVDRSEPVTSSKIAAGLITPITGQRLALSAGIDEFLPAARAFYRRVETQTGAALFHDRQAVRLFHSDLERQSYAERRTRPDFAPYIVEAPAGSLIDLGLADASGGGFHMRSAQLDVGAYLAASRAALPYEEMALDWRRDAVIGQDAITLGRHRARHLISCEGFAASRNPWFSWVPFNAAKGEILSVRFARPLLPVPIHRGIWLAPTFDAHEVRVGATYDLKHLDQTPTVKARQDIEAQLKALMRMPFEITGHHAAVRPIIHESKARVGLHPAHTRLGYFNGLGSKGALQAPWFARLFVEHLVYGRSLPAEHDIRAFEDYSTKSSDATQT